MPRGAIETVDDEENERAAVTAPGHLRTYLGSAPGVGKTYSMLAEGQRRAAAGDHVVVGWVERHGRRETRAQLGELEVIAPREATYRGIAFPELDVEAVLASEPDLVLVDELAHHVPDTGRQRWEDVAELLAAGIDVERLSRRCRTIGVEILAEGQVVRARTVPPPRMTPARGTPKVDGARATPKEDK